MFSLFDTAGLENGLNLCSLRNEVISSNIANANSPHYQARALVFEQELEQIQPKQTRPAKSSGFIQKPTVQETGQPVDIISEMASLAKNQILYTAYSDRISQVFGNLTWIIENSGR
jgi:flagellar basal-body rod protein FlgB